MLLTIIGAPRTKKNSQRIMRGRGGRPFVAQSAQHDAWAGPAILQLRARWGLRTPLDGHINLRALIYRERATGDLGNYLAAVCDVLERSGVVLNDKFIEGFDGSRMLKDAKNPRIEIELTAVAS